MRELLARVRKRGVRGSLHLLRERYIYYHWELLTIERDLSPPAINRPPLITSIMANSSATRVGGL